MITFRIRQKAKCPCCGIRVLDTKGKYEICPVCGWEDDPIQAKDHAFAGGANSIALVDARIAWKRKQKKK
ncbi:MAG: hypothetical protein MJ106_04115 [Lentisphaeria bacterium]|nr:hypothetical protein [Lentisphaeria bacterium]